MLSFATNLSLTETELSLTLESYETLGSRFNAKAFHFLTSRICRGCAC
jgi:hypothetical protein